MFVFACNSNDGHKHFNSVNCTFSSRVNLCKNTGSKVKLS